jgi:Mn-dependent DtxR family transcriptional regulator
VSQRRTAQQEQYAHEILSAIEAGHPLSQRTLASSLGIALGLTNLLLRRLVRKGLIRMARVRPNRVAYFLTPRGMAEKARMSRTYFQNSVRLYASARDRMRARFDELSHLWPASASDAETLGKQIVFVGTGEAAEIAYVCLQETDLALRGVVDFQGRKRFFGVPVHAGPALDPDLRACLASDRPVLVAFGDSEPVRAFINAAALPQERVFWI